MTAPVSSSSFDPLTPPGSGRTISVINPAAAFVPGQFVRASMDNTAFFNRRPRGNADADRLLARNTQMKVVSVDASYVRVELDSGEVGFVPSVMLETRDSAGAETFDAASPTEVQVYPPLPGGSSLDPLPVLDGLPPADAFPPPGAPDTLQPEGVVSPAAEGTSVPLPPTTPELEADSLNETPAGDDADGADEAQ
jgi:hypothetical protein